MSTDGAPRGFHTVTLGCKLNQFDGAAIEGELARRGYRPLPGPEGAAVLVVNTCTVTGKADAEARRVIRRLRRQNATGRLLVTGCYAELDGEGLAAMAEVDRVFGNRDKPRLPEILDGLGLVGAAGGESAAAAPAGDRGCDGALALPEALHFGERSRAFLKIQEGCRLACSYCIIPRVRGPSRSVPAEEIVRAAERVLRAGWREIVLTGVNTGDWGRDLEPRTSLAELLRRLLSAVGPNRIRLNSLEPRTVTDEVIALMRDDPRLAPHLQVPLQSGAEAILRRMRRNYDTALYLERLERVRAAVPWAGLGADVIVGFPGETDELFGETERLIADSPLNYLHVFAWSPRPGTPAATMTGRPHGAVVRERSARLRQLAARLSADFRRGFVGRRLDAVTLAERAGDGRLRALTGNFIEVTLPPRAAGRGQPVEVRIDAVDGGETSASLCGTPAWARQAGLGAPEPAPRVSAALAT